MQAYQHTPGPLKAERNAPDAFFLKDSEGVTVAEVIAMSAKYFDQIEANAKLFALAPELVDALETALSEGMQTRKGRDVVRFALDKIRRNTAPVEYTEAEMNCQKCYGPCGRCEEKKIEEALRLAAPYIHDLNRENVHDPESGLFTDHDLQNAAKAVADALAMLNPETEQ